MISVLKPFGEVRPDPKLPLSKFLYLLVEVAGLLANCLSAMVTRKPAEAFLHNLIVMFDNEGI